MIQRILFSILFWRYGKIAKISRFVSSYYVVYFVTCQKEVKTQARMKLDVSLYGALPLH